MTPKSPKNIVFAVPIEVYCMNPDEIWKSWDTKKKYAAFNTKTLAGLGTKDEIMKRLMVMSKNMKTKPQATDNEKEP